MILCFDVGNTDIYGGVIVDGKPLCDFRRSSQLRPSADELGVFLLQMLQAKGIDFRQLEHAAIASVVPDCDQNIIAACRNYLRVEPLVLKAGVRTGLKIRTTKPNEVGADRIANAIGAVHQFPGRNLVVIDMGTATTLCAINSKKEYLGGVILAGVALSMRALAQNTAKLTSVDIVQPQRHIGKTTVESIQIGLYHGHLGMMRSLIQGLQADAFGGEPITIVGTGGHGRLFRDAGIFDFYVPDLVLLGLCKAVELNLT